MIKVRINGETKTFEPGMSVQDILEEFDSQYLQYVCAVYADGVKLGLDDVVVNDCEMELLAFRDLSGNKPVEESTTSRSDEPSAYDFPLNSDEIAEMTNNVLSRYLGKNPEENDLYADEFDFMVDSLDKLAELMVQLEDYDENQEQEDSETQPEEEPEEPAGEQLQADEQPEDSGWQAADQPEELQSETEEFSGEEPAIDTLFSESLPENSEGDAIEYDGYDGDPEPDFDGEFISFGHWSAGPGEADLESLADEITDMADNPDLTEPAFENSGDDIDLERLADDISYAKTEEMQMHLGVPKIEDLVVGIMDDDAADDQGDAQALSDSGDYSIDDMDLDAFLASHILPDSAANDVTYDLPDASDAAETEDKTELLSWQNGNYLVDEDSINDFVDYSRENPSGLERANDPYYQETDGNQRKRRRLPLFVKAAVFAAVLLGIGWLVGRIAIQAAGSSDVVNPNGGKSDVSVSDVSPSDTSSEEEVSSEPVEKAPEFDKNKLAPGKSNALVEALQERLCVLGYLDPEEADGSYNQATASAINSFRKANDIKKKGTIDKETFDWLFDETAKTTTTGSTTTTEAADSTTSTTKETTASTTKETTASTTKKKTTTTTTTTTTTRKKTTAKRKTTTTTTTAESDPGNPDETDPNSTPSDTKTSPDTNPGTTEPSKVTSNNTEPSKENPTKPSEPSEEEVAVG